MRWILALGCVLAATRTAGAVRPAFDVEACLLDLDAGASSPKTLADLPHERGRPPPATTRFAIADDKTAGALAAKLVAALPGAVAPRIELDATRMASVVELTIPGVHTAAKLAPDVLAFVRAHPCLFGVLDPDALAAHDIASTEWIVVDVAPRSVGAIQAQVGNNGKTTRVRIEHHLWPIADIAPAIDPAKLLARYLGRMVTTTVGSRYLIDPKTHRHLGCVPIGATNPATASSFHWRAGPILACNPKDRVAEVRAGAYVWGVYKTTDWVLDELPGALAPDGTRIPSYVAPVYRAPGQDSLEVDANNCLPW